MLKPPKKVAFKTLGCRLNQFETDAIASQFVSAQYQVVDFSDKADVYILNTCTVTNQSDSKSLQAIKSARKKNQNAVVVVAGCMVNNHKEELQSRLDRIDYFVENKQKSQIFQLIDSHFKGELIEPEALPSELFEFEPARDTFHTRSFIKIQDGCDNFCTYCIVPHVRGRAISRPVEKILDNIHKVLDFGFKEIVLTGVNISRYSYESYDFTRLIEKILEIDRDFRVRISSIEPDGFTDRLFELFLHPRLTPHLHLCLQSGSDKILTRMRRFYTISSFYAIIEKIRALVPDFNFTTDIIVGFPGETEEDFQQTLKVIQDIGFSHIHTFKYSRRDGTRAARMEDQIPEKIKTERSRIVREMSQQLKEKYMKSFIGKEQIVLSEKVKGKEIKGYGQHYFPVELNTEQSMRNQFYRVKVQDVISRGKDIVALAIANS